MKQMIPMDDHGMFADHNDTARVDRRFVAKACIALQSAVPKLF